MRCRVPLETMAKAAIDEVEVLRFFETEPLDKATVLFNIVADKMQGRLRGDSAEAPAIPGKRRARSGRIPAAETAESPSAE